MNELLVEIVIYLLTAGLIGFVIGWLIRGGCKEKLLKKSESSSPKEPISKKESKQTNPPIDMVLLKEAKERGKEKLSLIKGIGPVLEGKLNLLGIYHFEQIASWNAEEQAWINTQIFFPKKVEREEWVRQAKELSQKS